jgi:hypothetical protein
VRLPVLKLIKLAGIPAAGRSETALRPLAVGVTTSISPSGSTTVRETAPP